MIKKKLLSTIVPIALGLIAFIFAFLLPGAIQETTEVSIKIGIFGMIFGAPKIIGTLDAQAVEMSVKGGLSILGLLSLLFLFAGIAMLVYTLIKKNKIFEYVGNGLLLLSGVLMFLLLIAGTNIKSISMSNQTVEFLEKFSFRDFYSGLELASGAILWGVFAILGGALGMFVTAKND